MSPARAGPGRGEVETDPDLFWQCAWGWAGTDEVRRCARRGRSGSGPGDGLERSHGQSIKRMIAHRGRHRRRVGFGRRQRIPAAVARTPQRGHELSRARVLTVVRPFCASSAPWSATVHNPEGGRRARQVPGTTGVTPNTGSMMSHNGSSQGRSPARRPSHRTQCSESFAHGPSATCTP